MTLYLQKKLADHAIAKAQYPMPVAVYLALFTASPGTGGSFANEVTGGSYAPVEITSKMSTFDLVTGIAQSTAIITFPTPTADWGVVSYTGVVEQTTSPDVRNILFYDPLATPLLVKNGALPVQFAIGQFRINIAAG